EVFLFQIPVADMAAPTQVLDSGNSGGGGPPGLRRERHVFSIGSSLCINKNVKDGILDCPQAIFLAPKRIFLYFSNPAPELCRFVMCGRNRHPARLTCIAPGNIFPLLRA